MLMPFYCLPTYPKCSCLFPVSLPSTLNVHAFFLSSNLPSMRMRFSCLSTYPKFSFMFPVSFPWSSLNVHVFSCLPTFPQCSCLPPYPKCACGFSVSLPTLNVHAFCFSCLPTFPSMFMLFLFPYLRSEVFDHFDIPLQSYVRIILSTQKFTNSLKQKMFHNSVTPI